MTLRTIRWRRFGIYALYLFVVTFVLAEIVARVATQTGSDGMPRIGRFCLLPYRPTAEAVRKWLDQAADGSYLVADPLLGWAILPNGKAPPLYTANLQAIRTQPDRIYTPDPPDGTIRIVTLGDSFTHCDDVANDETWQHYLEQRHKNWEVLNLGVPSFGTDQSLLRWRKLGSQFKSHFVILGIWPEDICRNLSVIRYYMAPGCALFSKPRFKLVDGSLQLVNSPVAYGDELVRALSQPQTSSLVADDCWYHPELTTDRYYYVSRVLRLAATLRSYWKQREARNKIYAGTNPAGIELTAAIAEQFDREVKAAGAIPIVLILPMRLIAQSYPDVDSFPLVGELKRRGCRVIDAGPALLSVAKERKRDDILPARGHLPPIGNELLSEEIERAMAAIIEEANGAAQATAAGSTPN